MTIIYKRNNDTDENNASEKYLSGISVITCTNRPNNIDQVFSNFLNQTYHKKELIVIINNNNIDKKVYENRIKNKDQIKVFKVDENKSLGECKRFAFNHIKYNKISFFDDDDYYGPNFLKDAVDTFNKLKCDIVGKKSFYVYFEKTKTLALSAVGKENRYVYHVADSSMVFKRKLLDDIDFPVTPMEQDSEFQRLCFEKGYKIYSAEKYNYVVHRHPDPDKNHDWKAKDEQILSYSKIIAKNIDDYKNYVLR